MSVKLKAYARSKVASSRTVGSQKYIVLSETTTNSSGMTSLEKYAPLATVWYSSGGTNVFHSLMINDGTTQNIEKWEVLAICKTNNTMDTFVNAYLANSDVIALGPGRCVCESVSKHRRIPSIELTMIL